MSVWSNGRDSKGFRSLFILEVEMSFITGSRAYGKPKPISDTDLVILVSEEDRKILESQTPDCKTHNYGSISLRFGKLNLIVCSGEKEYQEWVEGTNQLKARKPVTRDEAVRVFGEIRNGQRRTKTKGQGRPG